MYIASNIEVDINKIWKIAQFYDECLQLGTSRTQRDT